MPVEKPVKKGDFVRLVREKFENSVEAKASDTRLSSYLFDTRGEILGRNRRVRLESRL